MIKNIYLGDNKYKKICLGDNTIYHKPSIILGFDPIPIGDYEMNILINNEDTVFVPLVHKTINTVDIDKKLTSTQCMFIDDTLDIESLTNDNDETIEDPINYEIFSDRLLYTIDISNLDTSNVTDMTGMFFGNANLKTIKYYDINLEQIENEDYIPQTIDTSNVTNMSYMFFGCANLNILLLYFNTSNVTDMSYMFAYCDTLYSLYLDNWNLKSMFPSEETDDKLLSYPFLGCTNLNILSVNNWQFPEQFVAFMLFAGLPNLTKLDLSTWDTSNFISTKYMFAGGVEGYESNLEKLYLDNFDLSHIEVGGEDSDPTKSSVARMFDGCNKLKYIRCKKAFKNWCIQYEDIIGLPEQMRNNGNGVWDIIDLTAEEASIISHDDIITFNGTKYNNYVPKEVVLTTSNSVQFNNPSKITFLNPIKINSWSITNKHQLNLIENLHLIDTSNVTNMSYMFQGCYNLTSLDVSNFDTSNVTNMSYMFQGCSSLKEIIGIENWVINKGISLYYTFANCNNIKSLNLQNFKCISGFYWRSTFENCYVLTTLYLDKCDLSKYNSPGTPYDVFKNCYNLNYIRCKKTTREWCWKDQDTIKLPNTMREGGSGFWDLVDTYDESTIEPISLTIIPSKDIISWKTEQIPLTVIFTFNAYNVFYKEIQEYTETFEVMSDNFGTNEDYDNTRKVTLTYEYHGLTATATITQKLKVDETYVINLNNEWELSTTIPNPDTELYDGVYQSFAHKGVGSSIDTMTITIKGYENFKLYIRSYAEGNNDYVMVSQLDKDINGNTSYSNTTLVKAHTRGKQSSLTSINFYTLVEFNNIDKGEHVITIIYRKNSSVNSNNDRGYVLIPKNQ